MSRTKTPSDKRLRVYRGGSGNSTTAINLRAAFRYDGAPTFRSRDIGFRLTQSGCRQPLKEQP